MVPAMTNVRMGQTVAGAEAIFCTVVTDCINDNGSKDVYKIRSAQDYCLRSYMYSEQICLHGSNIKSGF